MAELVSILIPAYNSEKWIRDTIKSALGQTWPQKEIIIVDDGSSDNTLRIAREFESKSLKVITQGNKGASSARNKALSIAQGEYIQWLDADDLLAPDKISQQFKYNDGGQNSRILLSSAWGRFYFRHQKARFISNSLCQDLEPVEWLYKKMNENAWMGIESWLVSRRLTELAGPWNERLLRDNDGEYFCRVVSASEKIRFVSEAKSYCRMGNFNSISSDINISDQKIESLFLSICLYIKYLRSLEDSERTRAVSLKFLQRWLIYFYPEKHKILKRANDLAQHLGGSLSPPALRWKYSLIKKFFGWKVAKKAQFVVPRARELVIKNWDRFIYTLSIDTIENG